MPGIVGIINKDRASAECRCLVRSMVKCLIHGPFYTDGIYTNEKLGLWSGWACHKGSFADCLPIWNEEKDVCLLFSGEDFADQVEIDALRMRGHEFGSGDASYLVHQYEEMGCEFLEKLNGWFSGVLLDLREQKFVLFNDRYGVNRLYFHEDAHGFYFSSEAKALLKILACASRPPGTLPCYTWGGKYRDCADVKIARRTAKICQQPHQTIVVGLEFLSQFPDFAERAVYISDGTMDVTGSIDLYVQGLARQIAPVRLSGVCGGEILRRLVMFKPGPPQEDFFDPELARSFRNATMTYANELQGHKLSFTAFRQAPWYMASKFTVERSQLTYRTPYFDNDLVALAYQTPPELLNNEPALRLITDGNPALGRIGTDRGVVWRTIPGLTPILHAYQEFTFKAEYAYDYRMPQWLARLDHTFAPLHLEKLFIGRHKFHHFRIWYRVA